MSLGPFCRKASLTYRDAWVQTWCVILLTNLSESSLITSGRNSAKGCRDHFLFIHCLPGSSDQMQDMRICKKWISLKTELCMNRQRKWLFNPHGASPLALQMYKCHSHVQWKEDWPWLYEGSLRILDGAPESTARLSWTWGLVVALVFMFTATPQCDPLPYFYLVHIWIDKGWLLTLQIECFVLIPICCFWELLQLG